MSLLYKRFIIPAAGMNNKGLKLRIIFLLIGAFTAVSVFADCTFNITNYSDTPVVFQAGFYKGESATETVGVASSKNIKIKNALSCNAMSAVGFGVTYINLITKKSEGGWVYVPAAKMIRGIGISTGSQDMVLGIAPNGEKLVLFNNTSPNSDSFDVRIEKAGRNISRQTSSMN